MLIVFYKLIACVYSYAFFISVIHNRPSPGKVVASVCHGAWMLCSAHVLSGKKLTCYHSIRDDVENAGYVPGTSKTFNPIVVIVLLKFLLSGVRLALVPFLPLYSSLFSVNSLLLSIAFVLLYSLFPGLTLPSPPIAGSDLFSFFFLRILCSGSGVEFRTLDFENPGLNPMLWC